MDSLIASSPSAIDLCNSRCRCVQFKNNAFLFQTYHIGHGPKMKMHQMKICELCHIAAAYECAVHVDGDVEADNDEQLQQHKHEHEHEHELQTVAAA